MNTQSTTRHRSYRAARSSSCRLGFLLAALCVSPTSDAQEGNVVGHDVISRFTPGLGDLNNLSGFGGSIELLAGLGGGNVLAVGARGDSSDSFQGGSVRLLFLDAAGGITGVHQIDPNADGLVGTFQGALFGASLADLGDIDGDGTRELAVGGPHAGASWPKDGAIWILSLAADGSVVDLVEHSAVLGDLVGVLPSNSQFGAGMATVGDLDGDGIEELAVGAPIDVPGELGGSAWILFLAPDKSIRAFTKLSGSEGVLSGLLLPGAGFGSDFAALGDSNGDGLQEVAVGAPGYEEDPDHLIGAVLILSLTADGTIATASRISGSTPPFVGLDMQYEQLGSSVAFGDVDGDGSGELVTGGSVDGEGLAAEGSVRVLELDSAGAVLDVLEIASGQAGFEGETAALGAFGHAVELPGDLDGDGRVELLVGAPGDLQAGSPTGTGDGGGALWQLDFCSSDVHAGFSATPDRGFGPLTVSFMDETTGTNVQHWSWWFGDGATSSDADPTHVYTLPGTYEVELTATDAVGCYVSRASAAIRVLDDDDAHVVSRNGSGRNPEVLSALGYPVLGSTWTLVVDVSALAGQTAVFLFGYQDALPGFPLVPGELLVDPASSFLLFDASPVVAGSATFTRTLPSDVALVHYTYSMQALAQFPRVLTNALDATLGL